MSARDGRQRGSQPVAPDKRTRTPACTCTYRVDINRQNGKTEWGVGAVRMATDEKKTGPEVRPEGISELRPSK